MIRWAKGKLMAKQRKRSEQVDHWVNVFRSTSPVRDAIPEREHRFHPTRRWRFDVAFPEVKLAVEFDGVMGYQGGRPVPGRHQTPAGMISDNEKANAAVLLGWRVLRFTTGQLSNSKIGDTVDVVSQALCGLDGIDEVEQVAPPF